MSEQNCVLACGLGQGRLRAAIGRSFTTVRLAVPEISCSLPLREISTAARFAPCLLPPQAAARRETPFESPSYQKRKALLRSAFLFWQPNRDSNPNIQSQSLLCYRYTIRLYLLLAENSISVCSPVVNSFLQFSKNYA